MVYSKPKVCRVLVGGSWIDHLLKAMNHESIEFELYKKAGRPLGADRFKEKAEKLQNKELKMKKPYPKNHEK